MNAAHRSGFRQKAAIREGMDERNAALCRAAATPKGAENPNNGISSFSPALVRAGLARSYAG